VRPLRGGMPAGTAAVLVFRRMRGVPVQPI
jgi:hypothetical protein